MRRSPPGSNRCSFLVPRLSGAFLAVAVVIGLLAASAWAANVVGTVHDDVLRGSAKADKLYGKAGNDNLYGLAGDD